MTVNTNRKRLATVLASLLVIVLVGWAVQAVAQDDAMMKQMEMMKQMMMNRPAAMKKADESIQKQKQTAMKTGKYACCLKTSCNDCALHMGECPCGMNAAKDMAVCNECKGGWHAGNGSIPGKTAEQIKTWPRMGGGM